MGSTRSPISWRPGCRWCRDTGSGWPRCPATWPIPVWVDDPEFDIAYHVRRNGLPRPGTEAQLLDLVSRLASRPLDRTRPLWEMYLVDGLSHGRVAVVTKTHPALVDGLSAIDIGQVLLDVEPEAPAPEPAEWRPERPPTGTQLLWDALDEYARRPSAIVDTARAAVTDVRSTAAPADRGRRRPAADGAEDDARRPRTAR